MGSFHLQQTWLLLKMAILFQLLFLALRSSSAQQPSLAKPNCLDHCGDIGIPYPFGISEDCYQNISFWVTCDQTLHPPKLFIQNSSTEILTISLDGQLRILTYIARDCYVHDYATITRISTTARLSLPDYITVNNTHNKFTIVGCDAYGFVSGSGNKTRHYRTGCTATCYAKTDLEQGSCSGIGCCQTNIPKQVRRATLTLESYNNYTRLKDFDNCSHAFIVEEASFSFSPENITNLKTVQKLPMVADWAIGIEKGTCEQATQDLSSYACKSNNAECYKPVNGKGYRCSCKSGYRGNPYLIEGCQDIDECNDPNLNICEKQEFCRNADGIFTCVCPKGYHGDGKKEGKGCIRGESGIYRLVAGIASGVVILLLSACLLYLELKRRSLNEKKRNNFSRNGGYLLQGSAGYKVKIYRYSELRKATKNFHASRIIGSGGFGTVYQGDLPDNTRVAIKKSKQVDKNHVNQFVNEVIVLSQINHRNVVKLLGCCLDTEAPLLIYEFICKGTLSEHIHDQPKTRLDWDMRLRIATEAAGALSYLHYEVSSPILHRDIKTTNILLDDHLTVKVADFGLSRLAPVDQTQISTVMQGTIGYIDPEYNKTNRLTEKSDVYSFGVVLAELLTGRKAFSNDPDIPESEKTLANFFLCELEQERLSTILDGNISSKENSWQLRKVAWLAKGCLEVKGDHRPSMKDVAKELEGLSGVQVQSCEQEMAESLPSPVVNDSDNVTDCSTSNTYEHSLTDDLISPMQTSGR